MPTVETPVPDGTSFAFDAPLTGSGLRQHVVSLPRHATITAAVSAAASGSYVANDQVGDITTCVSSAPNFAIEVDHAVVWDPGSLLTPAEFELWFIPSTNGSDATAYLPGDGVELRGACNGSGVGMDILGIKVIPKSGWTAIPYTYGSTDGTVFVKPYPLIVTAYPFGATSNGATLALKTTAIIGSGYGALKPAMALVGRTLSLPN